MSIAKAKNPARNPPGFPDRLRHLMRGRGFNSRDLSELSGVSHTTIDNWLSDSNRATPDQVGRVADVFGWGFSEFYDGHPPRDIMTRVAELEAFRTLALDLGRKLTALGGPEALPQMGPGTRVVPSDLAAKKG